MKQEKRLDKVEKYLTPKQVVILWLDEVQQHSNVLEYVRFLRRQPESAAPINKLTHQVDEAVCEAMRGRPKKTVEFAVRRAVRDVVFLIKLHHQANFKMMTELRAWRLALVALGESLDGIKKDILFRNLIGDMANQVNFRLPYPLDPDTASAVEAAIRNHVYPWEWLEDDDTLHDWLWDYLINKGAVALPLDSYEFHDGKYCPTITEENKKAIRDCFPDDAKFELFRSGHDYTKGLASLTDAEYNAHYHKMVTAMQELMDSGQVQSGATVFLDMVPIPFLQEIPLVEGTWLDRYVVALAEWGALLQTNGYQFEDEEDQPSLAIERFFRSDEKEVIEENIQMLKQQADRHLTKFPGRTRKIEGRLYIHFEDYHIWRGRKVKGELPVQRGLVTASWNKWVNNHDGEGKTTVSGISIGNLWCGIRDNSYYSCSNGAEEHLRERKDLLESMRHWHTKRDGQEEQIQYWKFALNTYLAELYAFRQADASIRNGYFDDHQILFPDLVKELEEIVTDTEDIVDKFNEIFVDLLKLSERIDLEALRQSANKEAPQQMTYLVDMAKAEALDELGEREAGVEIAERHL